MRLFDVVNVALIGLTGGIVTVCVAEALVLWAFNAGALFH